jgi:hypothetical protein
MPKNILSMLYRLEFFKGTGTSTVIVAGTFTDIPNCIQRFIKNEQSKKKNAAS